MVDWLTDDQLEALVKSNGALSQLSPGNTIRALMAEVVARRRRTKALTLTDYEGWAVLEIAERWLDGAAITEKHVRLLPDDFHWLKERIVTVRDRLSKTLEANEPPAASEVEHS